MDILRVKKAQLPSPPITSTKNRKVTIADSDSGGASPMAGSSTGPGTLIQGQDQGAHGSTNISGVGF